MTVKQQTAEEFWEDQKYECTCFPETREDVINIQDAYEGLSIARKAWEKEKKPVKKQTKEKAFQDAAIALLEEKGWRVAVIGATKVVRDPESNLKLNYWLVIEFTGGK